MSRFPKYFAELIGTFCLVFAGTGAIIVDAGGGGLGHVGVSLVFGLVVLAMIYAVGHVSGAHINPAVSVGFAAAGRMPLGEMCAYIAAQITGAVAASVVLRLLFPASSTLGETLPAGSPFQSLILEAVMTFILMFVVMGVAVDDRAEGAMAGIAIGATVAFEALLGGPISGASMNPARSLAPALVSGRFQAHWIYWLAPIAGAIAGAYAYRAMRCESSSNSSVGCC